MPTTWADRAARGLDLKVANTLRRLDANNQTERPIITTLYEDEDLQQQLIVQRAAAIAQDILFTGSVLFTFPASEFPNRTTAYGLIQEQIGKINNVRPISQMGTQRRQELIVEVQFDLAEATTKAITIGVTHKERCYKGTPTNVSNNNNNMVKLLLNNVPWTSGLTSQDFTRKMKESLGHYGRVCQLRKHTCAGGFFEGEVSALLDVSDDPADGTCNEYIPLGRNVYLEWCDRYVSASCKGAPVVCHHCRKSGHVKKNCPVRPELICFKCHKPGHRRLVCPQKDLTESEELDQYVRDSQSSLTVSLTPKDSAPKPTAAQTPVSAPKPHQTSASKSHVAAVTPATSDSQQAAQRKTDAQISTTDVQDDATANRQDANHQLADETSTDDEEMQDPAVPPKAPLPHFRPAASSASKYATTDTSSNMQMDPPATPPPTSSGQLTAYHRQTTLTPSQIQSFKYVFPKATDYIVNKHCGIFCFNRNLSLVNPIYQPDGRFIIATVNAATTDTAICHIANVYAPASRSENTPFLNALPDLEPFANISSSDPWLFMGDLNDKHLINSIRPPSSSARPSSECSPATQFAAWLRSGFTNQFPQGAATFNRPGTARSTLDFLFSSFTLDPHLTNPCQRFLPQQWCDHDCLSVDLLPQCQDMGPGTWRFNTVHLDSACFCKLLVSSITAFYSRSIVDSQFSWESVKILIQTIDREYGKLSNKQRKDNIHSLQSIRQMEMDYDVADPSSSTAPSSTIQQLEAALEHNIQIETEQYRIRSATRWKEQGERCTRFFYSAIKHRARQQMIQGFRNETTNDISTSPDAMLKAARQFYQVLYTAEPVDPTAISAVFSSIPDTCKLSSTHQDSLVAAITMEEVDLVLRHAPHNKSPGLDGLPFEVYHFLFDNVPAFRQHLVAVLNDALLLSVMPVSWKLTKLVLLFKKGDPFLLKNWRPLSLINADAKILTKVMANRLNKCLHLLINPYQTGFMRNRLISDNGWTHQALMDHLQKTYPTAPFVSVLLDQEKAYDRISPVYLSQVLRRFNLPLVFIDAIDHLFFETNISLSINGWLGTPFQQKRGLRQGDPLSPLLFNLAFEPLLRHILASRSLPGIRLPFVSLPYQQRPMPRSTPVTNSFSDRPLKILCYADDLAVMLSGSTEWPHLIQVMELYGRASNARINIEKTVVVSLSGAPNEQWQRALRQASKTIEWHDSTAVSAVRYLGYPLYSHPDQLTAFLGQTYMKVQRHAAFLAGRNLSIRGASLVANSLLLSRIWHILRVVPVPSSWLQSVRRLVSKFVLPFARAPSWETVCRPKALGGLGLIDLEAQHLALHLVYIQRILRPASEARQSMDFTTPFVLELLAHHTGLNNVLPLFVFPAEYAANALSIRTGKMPMLHQLLKVIMKLPPLHLSFSWHCRWFLDLPLRCVLRPANASASLPPIPMRWLLSDLLHQSSRNPDRLSLVTRPRGRRPQLLQELVAGLRSQQFEWLPCVQAKMDSPLSVSADLLPASWGPTPVSYSTLWLPKFPGWTVDTGRRTPIPVALVSISALRRSWQSASSLLPWPHPPLAARIRSYLPHLPARHWKALWSADFDGKALQRWWRFLHNSIVYNAHRHLINASVAPICSLCTGYEDRYHFVLGCPYKTYLWLELVQRFSLSAVFPNIDAIWMGLTFDPRGSPLLDTHISFLGRVFSVIWTYHYQCTLGPTATWVHQVPYDRAARLLTQG